MAYACTLYDSISQVPPQQWESLREPGDLATDPRLLETLERTLVDQCRCWTAVISDEAAKAPVAAACLCLFRVDALDTTGSLIQTGARWLRRVWPGAGRIRVLFCGLPVPSGDNHLRIRPDADAAQTLRTLDRAMRDLARRERASMVVFKEFDQSSSSLLSTLEQAGYVRGEIPAAYVLRQPFKSFDELRGQLRSQYRWKVNRSIKRFEESGLHVDVLHGQQIADVYSEEVHALYESVWSRAEYRLEKLPPEFFREAGRRFGESASMTVARDADNRIVAFIFGLTDANGEYHNLYGGVNQRQDAEDRIDLYFNIQYHDLDRALKSGAKAIHLGQTADEFKVRLGGVPRELFAYARAVNPVFNWGLRKARTLAFPAVPHVPAANVFKSQSGGDSEPARSKGSKAGKGGT